MWISTAVILAGGKGTRLGCTDKPKPMYLVREIPIIGHQVQQLYNAGVKRVIIAVPANESWKDQIRNYFIENFCDMLNISFVISGDTIFQTMSKIKKFYEIKKDILLLCGDIYSNIDIAKLAKKHSEEGKLFTIASIFHKNTEEYGKIVSNKFCPPPHDNLPGWVDSGIWAVSPEFFIKLKKIEDFGEAKKYIYQTGSGQVYYCLQDTYWFDIGRPEKYQRACQHAKNH